MNNIVTNIPARLHSVGSDGIVTTANEIYDTSQSKNQQTINSELRSAVNTAQSTANSANGHFKELYDQNDAYLRYVIALGYAYNTDRDSNYHPCSSGRVVCAYGNGFNPMYSADYNMVANYSPAYSVRYSLFTNYENESTSLRDGNGFRPCVFKYNNQWYCGLEYYYTTNSIISWYGTSPVAFTPFAVAYYNMDTGSAINSEINDSIKHDASLMLRQPFTVDSAKVAQTLNGLSNGELLADYQGYDVLSSTNSNVLLFGSGYDGFKLTDGYSSGVSYYTVIDPLAPILYADENGRLFKAKKFNVKTAINNEINLSAGIPVYAKIRYDGYTTSADVYEFIPVTDTGQYYITQQGPTSKDNCLYIYLGIAVDSSYLSLAENHPVYVYASGKRVGTCFSNLSSATVWDGDLSRVS